MAGGDPAEIPGWLRASALLCFSWRHLLQEVTHPTGCSAEKAPSASPLVTQQGQHCHQVTSSHRHHLLDIQKEDLVKISYTPVPVTAFLVGKPWGKDELQQRVWIRPFCDRVTLEEKSSFYFPCTVPHTQERHSFLPTGKSMAGAKLG